MAVAKMVQVKQIRFFDYILYKINKHHLLWTSNRQIICIFQWIYSNLADDFQRINSLVIKKNLYRLCIKK